MDNHDYTAEISNSSAGQKKLTIQETARERTEELLRNSGLDPKVFYANFDVVDLLIQTMIQKADTGFHVLKASFSGNDTILIIKDESGEAKVSTNVSGFATHLAIGMMVRESFGLELRSYFNGGKSEPESLTPETPQALRNWLTKNSTVESLSSQQCIDIHCIDLVTGKFLEPERNVAYCDGWELFDTDRDGENPS